MDSASCSSAANNQPSAAVGEVLEENPNGQLSGTPSFKYFQFEDLKTATNNFGPEALLGEGCSGTVYKGYIDKKTLAPSEWGTGMAVAVKLWNPESIHAFEQWQSEMNILGRRYHPNLVELFGYCLEDKMLILVYEFMQKGSLKNHLCQKNVIALSWDSRLKIAIGAARGLLYLHTLEKQIIYRDFKSSAILLDKNYNPKLSKFGLAKPGPSGDKTHVTTRLMSTVAYAAPEYIRLGHLSAKCDVYSFGVVLLELLTGLRAENPTRPKDNLVERLKPILSDISKLETIMDIRMKGQYSPEEASQTAQLTLQCLYIRPKYRPSMKEVMDKLVQIEAMSSMKKVPKVLGQIEVVTSLNKVPKVLEQNKAIEEEPKNSKVSSPQSTSRAPSHVQPKIHNRFVTSVKASCQYVSSKLNRMRMRNDKIESYN